MAKQSFKKNKVEERMLSLTNSFLRKDVHDPRLRSMSITKVDLHPDYAWAIMYWDTFDRSARDDIKSALNPFSGKIRAHLARILGLRQMPSLKFKYDDQLEAEDHIMSLLRGDREGENSGGEGSF